MTRGRLIMDTNQARALGPDDRHEGDASTGTLARLSPHHLAIMVVGVFVALISIDVLIAVVLIADVSANASAVADRHARFAVAIDAAALHANILIDYLLIAIAVGIALTGIVLRTVQRTARAAAT